MRSHALIQAGFFCLLGAVSTGCGSSCPQANAAPPAGAAPATSAGASSAADKLTVAIDAHGGVRVDGAEVAADAVAAAVAKAHPDASRVEATIFADDAVPHGKVVQVLDQLRKAGILKLGIVVGPAERREPAPSGANGVGSPAAASPLRTAPAVSDVPPGSAPDQPAPAPASSAAAPSAPPAAPGSLPEVKVENIGLHIGGGPNDEASKQPFKQAIEPHFDDFRKCYALVEEPAKGGTFGVDLHVGRDGGKPDVKQPRTGIKGAGFKDCMVEAFSKIEFDKPHKPVVFSYSLRFTVGG